MLCTVLDLFFFFFLIVSLVPFSFLYSNHDSDAEVDEPLVTRQEQRPLYTPVKADVTMHKADEEAQQPRRDKSGTKLLDSLRQINGNQRQSSSPPTDASIQVLLND